MQRYASVWNERQRSLQKNVIRIDFSWPFSLVLEPTYSFTWPIAFATFYPWNAKHILCTLDYDIRTFRLLFNGKSMLLMLHMQCTFPCKRKWDGWQKWSIQNVWQNPVYLPSDMQFRLTSFLHCHFSLSLFLPFFPIHTNTPAHSAQLDNIWWWIFWHHNKHRHFT